MKLYGKLVKGTKIAKETLYEKSNDDISYRDLLEVCFLGLCRELDIM